jgi:MoaA/NifB/PqqE/SkfB family radical SAM enzyme
MSANNFKKIFNDVTIPNLNRIIFNGNFGDPIINNELFSILDYAVNKWPTVLLDFSTNGAIRNVDWWTEFAVRYKNNIQVRFCIDGLEDTNHIYRINVKFDKAIANARAFIQAGGNAVWQWITFRHNQHQVESAKKLAEQYGFKSFKIKEYAKTQGFVFTNNTNGYWIMPNNNDPEPARPTKFEPVVRKDFKHLARQELKWQASNRQIDCATINTKTVYICATGHVYPCSWTGQYPNQYKYTNFDQAIGTVDNNAIAIGFEKSIEWFSKVEKSWKCTSTKNGMLSICLGCTKNSFYQER